MKKTIILICFIIHNFISFGQSDMEGILKQIENNNPEIQANKQLLKSLVLDTKSTNNLANPTVSYSHLWDSKNKSETESELEIAQGFEFPTAYFHRNKANKKKISALEATYLSQRQEVLLEAKELCLNLIMLSQQHTILKKRLDFANHLFEAYHKKMNLGDATSIELNKVKLEKLNLETEFTLNEAEFKKAQSELQQLNGNQPIQFKLTEYSTFNLPPFEELINEIIDHSYELQSSQYEYDAAQKQIAISKAGWLPNLEVGYRRNSGTGFHSNGFSVGFSIPLFNNKGKVSSAKAIAISKAYTQEATKNKIQSEAYQAFQEAKSLEIQLRNYQEILDSSEVLELLEQALNGGELNITAYFIEVATVYQSIQNYIQIQNIYQKQIAKLYKHKL